MRNETEERRGCEKKYPKNLTNEPSNHINQPVKETKKDKDGTQKSTPLDVKAAKPLKKSKYSPLFSREGQAKLVVHLPGRVACQCQASKHKLINNCLICGRIVCGQEGSGPCMFCGNLVSTSYFY